MGFGELTGGEGEEGRLEGETRGIVRDSLFEFLCIGENMSAPLTSRMYRGADTEE